MACPGGAVRQALLWRAAAGCPHCGSRLLPTCSTMSGHAAGARVRARAGVRAVVSFAGVETADVSHMRHRFLGRPPRAVLHIGHLSGRPPHFGLSHPTFFIGWTFIGICTVARFAKRPASHQRERTQGAAAHPQLPPSSTAAPMQQHALTWSRAGDAMASIMAALLWPGGEP